MKRMLVSACLVALPGTALAQEVASPVTQAPAPPAAVTTPDGPEPIWGKVAFGMTRAQIEALYPRSGDVDYHDNSIEISDVPIMGKCEAEANIYFDETGVVDRVMIAGNPSMGGRCSEKVLVGLSSKYGEPLDEEKSHGSILAREGKIFIWNRPGGVTMRFKRYSNGIFGGGGLLKASWELTYSHMGGEMSL